MHKIAYVAAVGLAVVQAENLDVGVSSKEAVDPAPRDLATRMQLLEVGASTLNDFDRRREDEDDAIVNLTGDDRKDGEGDVSDIVKADKDGDDTDGDGVNADEDGDDTDGDGVNADKDGDDTDGDGDDADGDDDVSEGDGTEGEVDPFGDDSVEEIEAPGDDDDEEGTLEDEAVDGRDDTPRIGESIKFSDGTDTECRKILAKSMCRNNSKCGWKATRSPKCQAKGNSGRQLVPPLLIAMLTTALMYCF